MSKHKTSERTAADRPCADERRGEPAHFATKRQATDAAGRDRQAQQFFERVSQDREQSLQFLRKAGILDSSGQLAKPYRG